MQDQPKFKPYREGAQRTQVDGTVARGQLKEDALFYTGKTAVAGQPGKQSFADEFPFPVTRDVLDRGQERFNISCSVCHGRLGDGEGMVVKRGFRHPPSLHIERLRNAPAGYYFDVMTNGFGAMPDYAAQITPRDRWAIVAYIRALQLSQRVAVADLSAEDREKMKGAR
jgi:mono/diheme cytochrome c family protein